MADDGVTQRVAAILAADAAGYTRLMAADERGTIDALDAARAVFAEQTQANQGRIVDTAGDSVLAVFEIAAGAVQAAVAIQERLGEINEPVPEARRMRFRIGIHLGDIHEKTDGSVYGDGVNVAARLEGLAEPGTIVVSDMIQGAVRGRLNQSFADLGEHEVKNVAEPVHAYRVLAEGEVMPTAAKPGRARQLALAGAAVAVAAVIAVALWPSPVPPSETMFTADGTPTDDRVLAMPTGPSIVVLPFANLSTEADQDYFADGITVDIVAALSRFSGLFVYSADTTFALNAEMTGEEQAFSDLGARYVLKGSVRRAEEMLRVNAQLLSVESGESVWTQNYDRSLSSENIFALQDDISQHVAGAIAGAAGIVSRADRRQSETAGHPSLSAYECVLLSYGYNRTLDPDIHSRARDCLERTVTEEPDYAMGHTALSGIYLAEYAHDTNPQGDGRGAAERALEAARKALAIDQSDAYAHFVAANALFSLSDLEAFNEFAEQAISLNPNDPAVLGSIGAFMVWSGNIPRGRNLLEKGFALNPHQAGWMHIAMASAAYWEEDYDASLVEIEKANSPGFFWYHAWAAANYGQLGRASEAKQAVTALTESFPGFTAEIYREQTARYNTPDALVALTVDGLRKAGLPDAAPTPSRPVIAVLPFDSMSEDANHQFFADGVAEDIITRLARFPDIGVIARNSSFQYQGQNVDVRTVAEALGATYVLEGSVRRSENDIRIIAQLLDARDGTSIWSETYDRDLSAGSIFEIQDDVTERVVGVIASADSIIAMAVIEASATKAPSDLASYECVIRTGEYWRSITPVVHLQARTCLERVVQEEPEFARAWTLLAALAVDEFLYGFNVLAESDPPLDRASAFARRALELDPNEPWGHWNLGRVAFYRHNLSAFRTAAERALALLPNDAMLLAAAGQSAAYSGEWERGITMMDQAIKLNPHHQPWYHFLYFYEAYRQGLDDAALEAALKIEMPGYFWAHQVKAAAYGQLGMTEEAGKAVAAIHDLWPGYSIQTMIDLHRMWNHGDDVIERMSDGLRKAGLPDSTD